MENLEQVLERVESGDVFWFDKHLDVVAQARKELDDAKRLRELTTLRPIETAPKDETSILLLFEIEGWHRGAWIGGRWWMEGHHCGGELTKYYDQPIAWLPLPEPPQEMK